MICASCARFLSSQKMAGVLDRRARVTASLTQSWIGRILGLAGAENVALLDLLLQQYVARCIDDAHRAVAGDLEGLVVRTVFLGLLRHQADVGHGAHGGGIERAVLLAVLDCGVIHARVAAVGDHGQRVVGLAVGAPHLAAVADHRRHGRIDDHVGWHVQVGDAFVGIHHRQWRGCS